MVVSKTVAKRDDFPARVKRLLAQRVGFRCSNPACRRSTIGPASDPEKSVNLGVAAHITAAAPGGPRYNSKLTPQERAGSHNGLWACTHCSTLIDRDDSPFDEPTLRKWKDSAEHYARRTLNSMQVATFDAKFDVLDVDEDDLAFFQTLKLTGEELISSVQVSRTCVAALSDLSQYRALDSWPKSEVNLSLQSSDESLLLDLSGFAASIRFARTCGLVSSAGTGKTTTLVQLCEHINRAQVTTAIYFSLREWSANSSKTFFEYVTTKHAFREVRPAQLQFLAYLGKLTLVIDGWNEVPAETRDHAMTLVEALQREYPSLTIVFGGRLSELPVTELTFSVLPLNHRQQIELAQRVHGNKAAALVDRLGRMTGIQSLLQIPLYFNILMSLADKTQDLETKEQLIGAFVREHEAGTKNRLGLSNIANQTSEYLVPLAAVATRQANTYIQHSLTNSTIVEAGEALVLRKQRVTPLEPQQVLDSLASFHLLQQPQGPGGPTTFQHQQFQEWYASHQVESIMLSATSGDQEAKSTFLKETLNKPIWEEALLFAVDRLARRDSAGVAAVAFAIREALSIDPLLAAEMIHRATPTVWEQIRDEVLAFVQEWHESGHIDRAVRFMITSGRPDFADIIWPLVSNPDSQVHLRALRACDSFHISVLGSQAAAQIAALPPDTRRHVMGELAGHGDYQTMDSVADIAVHDSDPHVVAEVVTSFHFRRADLHVKQVLSSASPDTWRLIAKRGYFDAFDDPELMEALKTHSEAFVLQLTDPLDVLDAQLNG